MTTMEDLFTRTRTRPVTSSSAKLRVTIKDAPKKTTVWTVIGVDEDNWWNDYAPGMDCMKEFAPGTQVVVEVPPEAQETKQYKMLSEDENWASIKIDGRTHGQRLIVPGPSGIHTVGYCKVEWEYFAANVRIRPKSSDKCNAQHTHVCTQTMLDHADQGCRTSQVSRRLLNALRFRAPSDGRLVSMPVNIPKGRIDRVVVSLDGMGGGFAEPDGMKGCARIQCQEPLSTCSQEDELIKKLKNVCRSDLRTPVLFVASLLRSGERPKEIDDVFTSRGIIQTLKKYDKFLEIYVSDPANRDQPLPAKTVKDRVVNNDLIRSGQVSRCRRCY
eukprot:s8580_g3.t1